MPNLLPEGIRQRGNTSFDVRYRDANGARHSEYIKGATYDEGLTEAIRVLAIRRGDLAKGIVVTSKPNTVLFRELCADVVNNYDVKKRDSTADIEARFRLHLIPFFGIHRKAVDIKMADVEKYILARRAEGAKENTIKRELEAMRRAYRLGFKGRKVMQIPEFITDLMPEDQPARQGFYELHQLEELCRHLPHPYEKAARFAYITGWRHQEVFTRRLRHVTIDCVRMEPGETKNKKGREFPMVDDLHALIASIWPSGPTTGNELLFGRAGQQVGRFDKAWATAVFKAGLPTTLKPKMRAVRDVDGEPLRYPNGKLIKEPVLYKRGPKKGMPVMVRRAAVFFHDFRRTAYRNLLRMGVIESVAQQAVGWIDPATAARYNVIAKADFDALKDRFNEASKTSKKAAAKVRQFPART